MNSMKSQSESLAKEYDRFEFYIHYEIFGHLDNQIDGGEG